MDYTAFALKKFEEIIASIPANNCALQVAPNARVVDAGIAEPGGWTSIQALLEGLIGGRGIVHFGRQFYGGHQLPTVEMLLDAPVAACRAAFSQKGGMIGVTNGEEYALGVKICDKRSDVREAGNIVAASETSLLAAALGAARAVPDAVHTLLESGVAEEDILWGWSSAPVALLCNDPAVMRERMADAKSKRIISLWVRGDDALLKRIVEEHHCCELRLHSLASAKTFVKPRVSMHLS
ncbi:MAG: methenyltetrahydromethanopterin cyclohydrolase [Bacillota bacterium]